MGLNNWGSFTTKSFYDGLTMVRSDGLNFNGIWTRGIPSKINFFIWTVCLDKILTLNHLQNSGCNLANRCELCYR